MGLPGFTADVVFWAWWGGDSSDGETWRHVVLDVLLFEDDRELSELEVMVRYIRSCTVTQSSYPAVCTKAQLRTRVRQRGARCCKAVGSILCLYAGYCRCRTWQGV